MEDFVVINGLSFELRNIGDIASTSKEIEYHANYGILPLGPPPGVPWKVEVRKGWSVKGMELAIDKLGRGFLGELFSYGQMSCFYISDEYEKRCGEGRISALHTFNKSAVIDIFGTGDLVEIV